MSNDTRQEATYSDSACKWTPGPWVQQDEINIVAPDADGTFQFVAEVVHAMQTQEADTALIALAPEMAEAIIAQHAGLADATLMHIANGGRPYNTRGQIFAAAVCAKLRAIGGDQ